MNRNKPTIVGSNHPNSFLDSILGPTLMRRPWHFLARGDVFKGKVVKKLLSWINMLPIYRKSDAEKNNEKNLITFDIVADLVKKNRAVMIFPEGLCIIEKRLRPISKGTARMAFHACEKYGFDFGLEVVPAGINYTKPLGIRGDLLYNLGEPIKLKDYEAQYKTEPNRAIVELTAELDSRMKQLIVHINKGLDEQAEFYFDMFDNDHPIKQFPIAEFDNQTVFKAQKQIANNLNELQEKNAEQLSKLDEQIKEYREKLKANNIEDAALGDYQPNKLPYFLYLILFSPLWIYGFLTNFFILRFARKYPSKLIRNNVFYSSLRFGLIMIGYWLYFLLIVIILSIFYSFPIALAYIVFHLIAGYSYVIVYDYIQLFRKRKNVKSLNQETYKDLKDLRNALKRELNIKW